MSSETVLHLVPPHDSGTSPFMIETPRLNLCIPQEADLDAWAAIHADETARFLGGALSRAEAWGALAKVVGHWQFRGFGLFSMILKSSGRCVGAVGPWFPEVHPGRAVGFALLRRYWRQGLTIEALTAVLQWLRQDLQWTDIIHCIHPENKPSIALVERIGSTFLSTTTLHGHSYLIYGQDLSSSRSKQS